MWKCLFWMALLLHLVATETNFDGRCKDAHKRCSVWADLGECRVNMEMRKYCPKSCDSCSDSQVSELDFLCVDEDKRCGAWADAGECTNNPRFMLQNCQKSCNSCNLKKTVPKSSENPIIAGMATEDEKQQFLNDSSKFGKKQVAEGTEWRETLNLVKLTIDYMDSAKVRSLPFNVRDSLCKNQYELCSFWSLLGECKNNESFMTTNCAPACKSCHLLLE